MTISLTIPQNARVSAKEGSTIDVNAPLFSLSLKPHHQIAVAHMLGIKTTDIFTYLSKVIGDPIQKGEVIASKKTMMGKKTIKSTVEGTIVHIDHMEGSVSISTTEESSATNTVPSFFKGKIESIDIGKSLVTVSISNADEYPLTMCLEDGGGEILPFSNDSMYFTATEDEIYQKVIFTKELKTHIAAKCEALDAAGFVFVTGDTAISKSAQLSPEDFEKMEKGKRSFCIFSAHDKKLLAYD